MLYEVITKYVDAAAWFMNGAMGNDTVASADLGITYPVNITSPVFVPKAGSMLLEKSIWATSQPSINSSVFDKVNYTGAFGTIDWTAGWSNFDPINTVITSYSIHYTKLYEGDAFKPVEINLAFFKASWSKVG